MEAASSAAEVGWPCWSATTRRCLVLRLAPIIVRTKFRPVGEMTQAVRSTMAWPPTANTASSPASFEAP